MRPIVLTFLSATLIFAPASLSQPTLDVWTATPPGELSSGVLAQASVVVAARGDVGGGKIVVECSEEEGISVAISATKGVGRGNRPWRIVRLKFDKASFFDKDWLHNAQTAKTIQPEYVAYFLNSGTLAASLYVNVTGPDGKRIDLPDFPMYGFTNALKSFPSPCFDGVRDTSISTTSN